jgi:uncharacterized protein (TIRG00374 family)
MYFIGMFFNIGLPSLVGGDIVKSYLLGNAFGKPMHWGLASVLQDRVVGLITLLLFGSCAIALRPMAWRGIPLWIAYVLLWLAIGILLLFAVAKRNTTQTLCLKNRLFQKALQIIIEFQQAFHSGKFSLSGTLRVALYSFLYSALVLIIFQQVTVAAGHNVGIIQFSALFPLITVATMLPISFNGFGVREWVYLEALSLVGIPRGTSLMISLATSALFLLSNFGGIMFLPSIAKFLRQSSIVNRRQQADSAME